MTYKTFSMQLFSYRERAVFEYIFTSGLADKLDEWQSNATAKYICRQMDWDYNYGCRFLETLCEMHIVIYDLHTYKLSEYSMKYVLRKSKYYQGNAFAFEHFLKDSYNSIAEVLKTGARVFNTDDKPKEQYEEELHNYIYAMDNVATVRADELCDAFNFPDDACILDVAAGSGAFLFEILSRNTTMNGTYFDLSEVKALAENILQEKIANNIFDADICNRITFLEGDLLHEYIKSEKPFDIVFISNFIHCYSKERLVRIFARLSKKMKSGASCIIHDFFKDDSPGMLYDFHMMLNTYEGRTYFMEEMLFLCANVDLVFYNFIQLPSQSSILIFKKN